MCGNPDSPSSSPRVGARVDLFSMAHGRCGTLLFLDPSTPASSTATHVRYIQPQDGSDPGAASSLLLVSIHLSGDLTVPLSECGLFDQIAMPPSPPAPGPAVSSSRDSLRETNTEHAVAITALQRPLSLSIGDGGIIGRRVSVQYQGPDEDGQTERGLLLGDGIVGFNQ